MSKNLSVAIFAITTFLTPLHVSYAHAEESSLSKRLSLEILNTCKLSTVQCKKEDLLPEHLDILKQPVDRKSRLPQEVISMFEVGNAESVYDGDDGTIRPLKIFGINLGVDFI